MFFPFATRKDWALLVDRPAINAVAAASPGPTAPAPSAASTTTSGTSPSDIAAAATKLPHVLRQQEHGRADAAGGAVQQRQATGSRQRQDGTSRDMEADDAAAAFGGGCPVVAAWRDGREAAARAGAGAAGALSKQLSYYGHGRSAATEAAVPPVSTPCHQRLVLLCDL